MSPRDDQLDLVTVKPPVAYELLAVAGTVAGYSTCPSNLAEKLLVDLSGSFEPQWNVLWEQCYLLHHEEFPHHVRSDPCDPKSHTGLFQDGFLMQRLLEPVHALFD